MHGFFCVPGKNKTQGGKSEKTKERKTRGINGGKQKKVGTVRDMHPGLRGTGLGGICHAVRPADVSVPLSLVSLVSLALRGVVYL